MLLISLVCASLLAGCVQVTEEYPMRTTQLAVSSARDLPITYTLGSKFALSPKHLKAMSAQPELLQKTYNYYSQAIVNNLEAKGYVLAQVGEKVDFYVGFGLALSKDLTDTMINEKFGVTPGLHEDGEHMKGSFLIEVDDAITQQRVWRGTAQAYVHNEYTIEQHNERAAKVVNMLLTQYYSEK